MSLRFSSRGSSDRSTDLQAGKLGYDSVGSITEYVPKVWETRWRDSRGGFKARVDRPASEGPAVEEFDT
jgi:hypothetical protein